MLELERSEQRVCRKYDHITPVLQESYWLPVRYRTVHFNIFLLTFKALNGKAPTYVISHNIRVAFKSMTNYAKLKKVSYVLQKRFKVKDIKK